MTATYAKALPDGRYEYGIVAQHPTNRRKDKMISCGIAPDYETATRKLRPDLTPEELERLQKYGSIEFASAGATRKR